MKSLPEEKEIYAEIQRKLFYIIPEKWDSIYLYASCIEMPKKRPVGEMYFYYFPKGIIKTKPVNCYEIPASFNIDEDEYSQLITDLYNVIKRLRQIWAQKTKKLWTNITISIENFQFKIEYDYEDLKKSRFDSYARHVIWRFTNIDSDIKTLSRNDRKIIDEYYDYIERENLPRKDVYIEGIYKQPVRNIVDFEKTLSVEEALAQSERDEDDTNNNKEKKKRSFFKRKRVIEDIIEEDSNEFVSNQILNWKKND